MSRLPVGLAGAVQLQSEHNEDRSAHGCGFATERARKPEAHGNTEIGTRTTWRRGFGALSLQRGHARLGIFLTATLWFLLVGPHAKMNFGLRRPEAEDVAAYIGTLAR